MVLPLAAASVTLLVKAVGSRVVNIVNNMNTISTLGINLEMLRIGCFPFLVLQKAAQSSLLTKLWQPTVQVGSFSVVAL